MYHSKTKGDKTMSNYGERSGDLYDLRSGRSCALVRIPVRAALVAAFIL